MSAKLHTPVRPPDYRNVFIRFGVLVGIIGAAVVVIYLEGGHIDSQTGEAPGLLDVVYFTMVTITTVGYGDIVPVSPMARTVDAFVLTPMRFIVLIMFVGIAYEFAFRRFQENFHMSRIVSKLNNHIIVCGYGETGAIAVGELLAANIPKDQIVVLDTNAESLDEAAKHGVVTMLGDSRKEQVLRSVAVERAAHVLICPGRDDTAVLIALTVGDLNPNAKLAAMCHEQENIHLLKRSGLQTIISPAGGNLIAASTRRPHLVETLQDIIGVGGTLRLDERPVHSDEVGHHPRDLIDVAVVRVYRDSRYYNVADLPKLEAGDILIYVMAADSPNKNQPNASAV